MTRKDASKPLTLAELKALVAKGESQTRTDAPAATDDLPEAFWTDGVRVTRRPARQSACALMQMCWPGSGHTAQGTSP